MHEVVHTPVLTKEVIQYLNPKPGGWYCDGTVGRAGHSRLILEQSNPDGRLLAIDRDPEALEACGRALAEFGDRVTLAHGRFGDIAEIIDQLEPSGALRGSDESNPPRFDGLLLDIGPSSPQFDQGRRGFSFLHEGPIDMRMDPTSGETAMDLMRRLGPEELTRILRDYGEEKYAGRIAQRIKEALHAQRLTTTTELAALVENALPGKVKRQMKIHPATRTFQALRIAVNDELEELARFLAVFPALLAPGGRCVIISFHSLEDRLVKRCFRDLAKTSSLPPDLARQAGERVDPVCVPLTRKPVMPGEDEVARNPRCRSARLRACEKVAT